MWRVLVKGNSPGPASWWAVYSVDNAEVAAFSWPINTKSLMLITAEDGHTVYWPGWGLDAIEMWPDTLTPASFPLVGWSVDINFSGGEERNYRITAAEKVTFFSKLNTATEDKYIALNGLRGRKMAFRAGAISVVHAEEEEFTETYLWTWPSRVLNFPRHLVSNGIVP